MKSLTFSGLKKVKTEDLMDSSNMLRTGYRRADMNPMDKSDWSGDEYPAMSDGIKQEAPRRQYDADYAAPTKEVWGEG